MNISQNNKLRMAQATLGCLQDETNAALWSGIVGIEEAVASLETTVASIIACGQKQTARTGFAAQKKAAQTLMLTAAFTICSGLKALASASDDKKLFAQADFSRSDLARGREADVLNRCQQILALGNENTDALAAKYNVSANDLKGLKTAIAAFNEVQAKPRQGRAASASATSELVGLFDELDKALNNQLDPLMTKFRFTNLAFYSEYQTARSIVDSAARHEAKDVTTVALPKAA